MLNSFVLDGALKCINVSLLVNLNLTFTKVTPSWETGLRVVLDFAFVFPVREDRCAQCSWTIPSNDVDAFR